MTTNKIRIELDDSRRLTGKSFVWDKSGAIIDCWVDGIDKQKIVDCWQQQIQFLLKALGWEESTTSRIYEDGVSLLLSAPMDALYAATEVNEVALALCCTELGYELANLPESYDPELSQQKHIENLKKLISEEKNPKLLEWIAQAKKNNVPCLVDDDDISLGYGKTSQTWQMDELPKLETINWQQYKSVPIAMITGTNGKSTTVRLTSEMIKAAGICCGVTSTDFIKVADEVIDEGDYSGPGGARILLRHEDTELALLEVARGGLLRRGLAVEHIDAALITNIAEDHFGQYGINNLDALTQAKCIVTKALSHGTLVLNADDAQLVKASKNLDKNFVWFSLDKNNPILVEHKKHQGGICYLDGEMMVYQDQSQTINIVAVNEVAMTFNGAAKHNIQNALGAIALAISLNINLEAIRYALNNFNSDAADNPGRGNRFKINNAEVILDFAHNPHSMKAMAETVKHMPANKKLLMLGAAGDRSNKDIEDMIEAALEMKPDNLIIAEVGEYLRGRELGEVPALIKNKAIELGQAEQTISIVNDSYLGAKQVVESMEDGDLGLIMALSHRTEIFELLEGY